MKFAVKKGIMVLICIVFVLGPLAFEASLSMPGTVESLLERVGTAFKNHENALELQLRELPEQPKEPRRSLALKVRGCIYMHFRGFQHCKVFSMLAQAFAAGPRWGMGTFTLCEFRLMG